MILIKILLTLIYQQPSNFIKNYMSDHINPEIELAYEYVCHTNQNIYLTGKAGTGKTTFLHRVKKEVPKRMIVVAPTGVAAINAKGMTIHSLFQLPFGPLVPGQSREDLKKRGFSRKKIDLLKGLDLLIIDEISMVRADVLDGIDGVLKRFRSSRQPFGGVQLLMIGDLHQLPPVVKPNEWQLLQPHYDTPYFFGCQALKQTGVVTIELKHIYRQSDDQFIQLLNRVRNNNIDEGVLTALNARYQPGFAPKDDEGYISLTAHNASAKSLNTKQLDQLPGSSYHFKAIIDGNFPPYAYPNEEHLTFKIGAQVMFIRNDIQPERRYYNGKIGKITYIGNEIIRVKCRNDESEIEVTLSDWENRKFELDPNTKEVQEEIIGTFTQYPLKLAYAITIHKSQGLTFDKVIIDAKAAFAHGQVYVALSRCKSFEGIVLSSQLSANSVKTDRVIQKYTTEAQENQPSSNDLRTAKRQYQQDCLLDLFDFKFIGWQLQQVERGILEHENSLQGQPREAYQSLDEPLTEQVITIAKRFIPQLQNYFSEGPLPEENKALQARIAKASNYFLQPIQHILKYLEEFELLTDNKAVEKKITEKLHALRQSLLVKLACFDAFKQDFSTAAYNKVKANAFLDAQKPPKKGAKKAITPKDIIHPVLYEKLVSWRASTADELEVPRYTILPTKTILEMLEVLPTNLKNLQRIHGIGKNRANTYGETLLKMVDEYCETTDLLRDQLELATGKVPKEPKPPKPSSKQISFELYQSGKSIEEIAKERELVASTIEGHLAHYVENGDLDIFNLMSQEKVDQIIKYLSDAPETTVSEAKNALGKDYSWGEIRMGMRYWERLTKNENS